MFKKNKKQTENIREKKVRTFKVGTHKKIRDCIVGGAYRKCELWRI